MESMDRAHPTLLERAYQLARSGQCHGVGEVIIKLNSEHYPDVEMRLVGRLLRRTLGDLCRQAQGSVLEPPPRPVSRLP